MATTNADPNFYRTEYMETVYDSVSADFEYDPLSPRIHTFIDSLRTFTLYTVRDGDRLTTIAHYFHGTTSTWWVILMVNGLASMNELEPGMQLRIPSLQELQALRTERVVSSPQLITI